APAPTVSSLTRATVTHAVAAGCGSDRSRTPFQSDATSVRNASFGQDGSSASTKPKAICAHRNVVERCINRLKQWRGLATRYENRAVHYRAMLVLASIVLASIVLASIVLWLEG